jgi:class 3 adenylate cyclase/tetratricopeptide (TPR) repeat protein
VSTDDLQDASATAPEPIRSAPEAERRQVTVLFCDLVDSTKLSQQLDAEEYRAVVRAYQEAAVAAVRLWDGYVAQYLGDGLLVYFGWPRAHEDAAVRAVYASLAMLEAMDPLNTHLEAQDGVRVQVRLGLHTGMAVIGEMGSGGRHEQLAMGGTPNIAARIQGVAAPNTLVISAATARLVHQAFALDDLGRHAFKGVAESMHVFRVLGPAEMHGAAKDTVPRKAHFLVGRDEEVGLLRRRWEQSKEGRGQVVLLSGEAGIGKSSLVETLRAQVAQEGLPRIAYRCSPYHTNSALYPVIGHLERLLRLERHDAPEAKLAKLEQALQTSTLLLDEVVPLIAALLAIPLHGRYAPLRVSPEQHKRQTLDALVTWLFEEAGRQPVLTVWEDLHWADPSTVELLGLVVEQAPTVPMLHMLTFRPEFVPLWPTRSHMTPITLNRLERPQVEALIAHLAGGKTLPMEVVTHIVAKTDGVPLFVEELTKMLLESALLREEADHYALTGPLSAVAIPATLQDSLMARLDQLNAAKEVAQLGAVLGREFSYEMLQALGVIEEATLQDGLKQLVEAELLYQRGRPPRARYIFKHALIQDAAYQSLLKSTRQGVHQRMVQVLEDCFPETAEAQPEVVAHHCTEAGLHKEAVGYWHKAGQRANEHSAYQEAVACFEQELEALQHLPECDDTREKAFDLRIQLRHALFPLRKFDQLLAHLREAEILAQTLEDQYRLGMAATYLGHYFWIAGEPTQAAMFGQRAVAIAQTLAHFDFQTVANAYLGLPYHSLGNYQQARHLLMKIVTSLAGDLQYDFLGMGILPAVCSRVWLAWTLAELGEFSEAMSYGDEGLRIAESVDHPYSLTHACFGIGLVYIRQGKFSQAISILERGHAISQSYSPVAEPVNAAHLSYALALSGQAPEAIPLLEHALEQAKATRLLFYHSLWVAWLGEAHLLARHLEPAIEFAMQALDLSRNRKERGHEAWTLRLLGEIHAYRNNQAVAQTEAYYQQALALATELGMRPLQAHCHLGLGTLYSRMRRTAQAQAELSTATNLYQTMGMTFWLP